MTIIVAARAKKGVIRGPCGQPPETFPKWMLALQRCSRVVFR